MFLDSQKIGLKFTDLLLIRHCETDWNVGEIDPANKQQGSHEY